MGFVHGIFNQRESIHSERHLTLVINKSTCVRYNNRVTPHKCLQQPKMSHIHTHIHAQKENNYKNYSRNLYLIVNSKLKFLNYAFRKIPRYLCNCYILKGLSSSLRKKMKILH